MATPANTTSTYDAIGNREDLSDMIYDISPTQTPFISGISREAATATNHEWQTDALATASAANKVIEGDDATTTAASPTVRLGNYTQISDKVPRVTRTQRQVDSAGRGDELDYQIMKSAKELKRDMESAILANKAKAVGSESVARELAGVESWLATNTGLWVQQVLHQLVMVRTPVVLVLPRSFAESQLKGVLASSVGMKVVSRILLWSVQLLSKPCQVLLMVVLPVLLNV